MKPVPLAIEYAVRFIVAIPATAGFVSGIAWTAIVVFDLATHGSIDFVDGPTSPGRLALGGVVATAVAIGCWFLLRWAARPSTLGRRRSAI